jgi:endonuclease/exonuclease/phosphatase family metal-dependent hydrolase
MRIMTYNVHSCIGTDRKLSHLRIAEIIATYDPDVVALQELDLARPRSGGIDQAARIAEQLEMHFHFHPALRIAEEQYGDALLSKSPLRLIRSAQLPRPPRRLIPMETRGALWAAVDFGATELQILTTHLGLLRRERRLQAKALLGRDWTGNPRCLPPAVLCGDFNCLPTSRDYRMFSAAFRDAGRAAGSQSFFSKSTFPARWPLLTLDYLFVTNDLDVHHFQIPRTKTTRVASDHLPVIVDIELPKARTSGGHCAKNR